MRLESAFSASRGGLDSHGKAISVVGDNVANANTVGYKASRVEFADLRLLLVRDFQFLLDVGPLQQGRHAVVVPSETLSGLSAASGRPALGLARHG